MSLLKPPPPPRRLSAPQGPQVPPPLYRGSVRLLDWKHTARGGMSVDLGIRDGSPSEPHPFKGLACGKEHGQRLKVWIGPHSDDLGEDERAEITPHYAGEGILMRWSDDSVNGMMIRTLIDAGPDGTDGKHPFEGFSTGRKEGDLLHLVVWAVAEDESLQHPLRTRRRTPFHELSETKQAILLCRDARFVSFLARYEEHLVASPLDIRPETEPEAFAAEIVRQHLGIESRADLTSDTTEGKAARRKWKDLMRAYFDEDGRRR